MTRVSTERILELLDITKDVACSCLASIELFAFT